MILPLHPNFLGHAAQKVPKMTILIGADIKWRVRAIFGSYGLNFFSQSGSRVTLPASEMSLALTCLSSEK